MGDLYNLNHTPRVRAPFSSLLLRAVDYDAYYTQTYTNTQDTFHDDIISAYALDEAAVGFRVRIVYASLRANCRKNARTLAQPCLSVSFMCEFIER